MNTERDRIVFIVRRDGYELARQWVERTLAIYREAVNTPSSHASKAEFRRQFDAGINAFQTWLNDSSPANPLGRFEG